MDEYSVTKDSKIYIAGHRGMVGSSILKTLKESGYKNIITKTSSDVDLTNQKQTEDFFEEYKPDVVILSAAKVGGILANNTYPAEFIYNNLMISSNVIHSSYKNNVKKLINLGSSCIYPKGINKPITEDMLLSDKLEKTNEAYAIAKIASLKTCQYYNRQYDTNYITLMPCNLYGPNDNYHPENSHVFPALIKKFTDAVLEDKKEVTLWGNGGVFREFLHTEDLANAVKLILEKYNVTDTGHFLNVGLGRDIMIQDLAYMVKDITGYQGKITWDVNKPNGVYRKLLNTSKIEKLGWKPKIKIKEGINMTIKDYKNTLKKFN